ncbi:MAG: NAD(P)/FAD-dependent oxidoreductase [Desulfovibrio sp.]
MSNPLDGAILQRDKQTYAIVPRTPLGLLTPEVLEALHRTVKKFGIPIVKITSGQRIALVGVKEEELPAIWEELGTDVGRASELCVHYVQACPGTTVCKLGVQDSIGLGLELEEKFQNADTPAKFKFGVSGCPLCCAESRMRDVGLIGTKKGWKISVGGFAGMNPRIGDILVEDLTKEEALETIGKFIEYYRENGKKKERTYKFLNRIGIDAVKEAIL